MVRKKPKTPQKKVPARGLRAVIDDCNEWTEFLIAGKYYKRIEQGAQACEDCGVKNSRHLLGCQLERCPACFSASWSCPCPPEMEVDIVCET